MKTGRVTPVLRVFDEAKAREFYLDFLGFTLDWEYRHDPDFPLYAQISLGDETLLHISEHHGDACPGAAIRIEIEGIDEYQQALLAKKYRNSRPGVEDMEWGSRDMVIRDPFGNSLRFTQEPTGK